MPTLRSAEVECTPPRKSENKFSKNVLSTARRPLNVTELTGHSSPTRGQKMEGEMLWHIHGRVYDLRPFVERHPGGSEILLNIRGKDDLTAIFESSHVFADRARIEAIMSKYEVGTCEPTSYTFDGFYRVLSERVRAELGSRYANSWWYVKSLVLFTIWLSFFVLAFTASSTWKGIACAIVSGYTFVSIGFVIMHDASHSAISSKPWVNAQLSKVWNMFALWDHRLWHKHHVFRHHSFTGDVEKDPDMRHLMPAFRKHETMKKPVNFVLKAPATLLLVFLNIFPGMFAGQMLVYARWWIRGHMWKIPSPKNSKVDVGYLIVRVLLLATYVVHPLVALAYLVAKNVVYNVCILPDHDTQESHANANMIQNSKFVDWGEVQVRNSANFATKNPIVCALYGGINFQIEHHLFPTLCHVHYATIQPIVRQTCKEFNIPYVEHTTTYSAYVSAIKAISTATSAATMAAH